MNGLSSASAVNMFDIFFYFSCIKQRGFQSVRYIRCDPSPRSSVEGYSMSYTRRYRKQTCFPTGGSIAQSLSTFPPLSARDASVSFPLSIALIVIHVAPFSTVCSVYLIPSDH